MLVVALLPSRASVAVARLPSLSVAADVLRLASRGAPSRAALERAGVAATVVTCGRDMAWLSMAAVSTVVTTSSGVVIVSELWGSPRIEVRAPVDACSAAVELGRATLPTAADAAV